MSFLDLLNEDYAHGPWLESEYRAAVNDMAKRKNAELSASIARNRLTDTAKQATRGLKHEDVVTFL
jgi:hypothetical protein